MTGVILGLAFLVAALAASAGKARAASAAPASPSVDSSVSKIVSSGDPHKMLAAAQVAHEAGDTNLATTLATHARNAAAAHPAMTYPSPFPSVPTPAWSKFVHALRGLNPAAISPSYHLGLFAFSMPRLVDLGLATNPHKIEHDGKTVWDADWVPALQPGPDKFLANPALQYDTFVKAVVADLHAIKEKFPKAVGSEIEGVKATPSGLLAVTKQAGLKGLETWLADPKTRTQYAHTTASFKRINGIF